MSGTTVHPSGREAAGSTAPTPTPGVLAVGGRSAPPDASVVRAALAAAGATDARLDATGGLLVATWGGPELDADDCLLLSREPRSRGRDLSGAEVAAMLGARDLAGLARVLPPFAAFRRTGPDEAVAVTDALGFRHLYHARWGDFAGFGTSARVLALLAGAAPDREAWALQSLLGWQVGPWTVYDGVVKLGAGELVTLRAGRLSVTAPADSPPSRLGLDDAVEEAAALLRADLAAYVGDHPDATLQLTGGQDSRILLSAVPVDLRRGLRAVTLRVPGSPDADLAALLAARTGLDHRVEELAGLDALTPGEAHALATRASVRLEGMADPLALAGLGLAERRLDQGHRIAGLGGEVARGFYYLGSARRTAVTRARVARLADWRMFANEAADPAALDPSLRAGARERAVDRIHALMAATGKDWFAATDDFYLRQRMQRWAGVTDTAVCQERSMVNPMLDDRFVAIAEALRPDDKRGSLFLARLQMALDPGLGRVPLDGRPPPEAYAHRGPANRARALGTVARKAAAKAGQRLGRGTRPPAGGAVLAAQVVRQWRRDPTLLERARAPRLLDPGWLDRVVAGEVDPSPATVALVLNVASLPEGIAP